MSHTQHNERTDFSFRHSMEQVMTSLRTFNFSAAIALVGACNPALAQGTPPSNGAEVSKLAEVIVTARQREESSQDVPVSIISLSGAQLQLSHLDLAAEIVPSIPNMQLLEVLLNAS